MSTTVTLTLSGLGTVEATRAGSGEVVAICTPEQSPCAIGAAGGFVLRATPAASWTFSGYVDTPMSQQLSTASEYAIAEGTAAQITALFLPQSGTTSSGTCGGGSPGCGCPDDVCPETVPSGLPSVAGLRLGPEHVYFLGSIARVPKKGGDPATLVPGPVAAFALDPDSLFFIDGSGTFVKIAGVAGELPSTFATASGLQHPQAIVTDASSVYGVTLSNGGGGACVGVMRAPKGGGNAVKVAETCDPAESIVPNGLAVDGASVYWTTVVSPSFSGGRVYRADKGATNATGVQLAKGSSAASRLSRQARRCTGCRTAS